LRDVTLRNHAILGGKNNGWPLWTAMETWCRLPSSNLAQIWIWNSCQKRDQGFYLSEKSKKVFLNIWSCCFIIHISLERHAQWGPWLRGCVMQWIKMPQPMPKCCLTVCHTS
jgi:hypothetical protein